MGTYKQRIINRIENIRNKKVFITEDFLDIASHETCKKTLNRLVNSGNLIRIINGIYDKPNSNSTPHDIALAISKKFNWKIIPTGKTALYELGIIDKIDKYTYICDGRYAKYKIHDKIIEFKAKTNKRIFRLSYKTLLIIEALKEIGQQNIDERIEKRINSLLSKEEKIKLKLEARIASSWIYNKINKITE